MNKDLYFNYILKVFRESDEPLSAEQVVAELKNNRIFRKSNDLEPITPSQIRDRIRRNKTQFEFLETKPLKYTLKNKEVNLWVLKTVDEVNKASQIDNYGDSLEQHYNYDSNVANFKKISPGDLAVLIDKEKILGFARIEIIHDKEGYKIIRRCPFCPSTTIDKRKKILPVYRCNKGHVFDAPIEEEKSVIKYNAVFSDFLSIGNYSNDLTQLRPFYSNNYNQNMSMQLLSLDALRQFEIIYDRFYLRRTYNTLDPNDAYVEESESNPYVFAQQDEREIIERAIRLRRGQQKFREGLLKRFNSTCVVTGSKIKDVLEAAHIMPYRGEKDNDLNNGLLLRADIHTLFDLNLVAIDPKTLLIHFHSKIVKEYSEYHLRKILVNEEKPSLVSLEWRWNMKIF